MLRHQHMPCTRDEKEAIGRADLLHMDDHVEGPILQSVQEVPQYNNMATPLVPTATT